jgi:hypothetical protein
MLAKAQSCAVIEVHSCMDCMAESMRSSGVVPYGNVSTHYLRRGWDWRHWQREPQYPLSRPPKQRQAKSA